MKLGVFTVLYSQKALPEMLDHVAAKGLKRSRSARAVIRAMPIARSMSCWTMNRKLKAFKQEFASRGLIISAFSCHGNPLHPNKEIAAEAYDDVHENDRAGATAGVPVVNTFSGCPGDSEDAKYPNWPVAPWPNDFQEMLAWQWENKVIPYWTETGEAEKRGVKIGLELHGGFSVHTPATLMRLREAVGDVIGANLDPSHMWWQGIDPVQAVLFLGKAGAIHHFHAKDTSIDVNNVNIHGVTDMQPYTNMLDRAWQFRTVGYGHDMKVWADIISALASCRLRLCRQHRA